MTKVLYIALKNVIILRKKSLNNKKILFIIFLIVFFLTFDFLEISAEKFSKDKETGSDKSYEEGYKAGYKAAMKSFNIPSTSTPKKYVPKIWFAEMVMKIGDPEDKILTNLKKRFEVEKKDNDWIIKSVDTKDTFGYIRFVNGKLASVGRIWASLRDPDSVILGKSLYEALDNLTTLEKKGISVTTETKNENQYSKNLILFTMENKIIRLSIMNGRGVDKIEVQEILY